MDSVEEALALKSEKPLLSRIQEVLLWVSSLCVSKVEESTVILLGRLGRTRMTYYAEAVLEDLKMSRWTLDRETTEKICQGMYELGFGELSRCPVPGSSQTLGGLYGTGHTARGYKALERLSLGLSNEHTLQLQVCPSHEL